MLSNIKISTRLFILNILMLLVAILSIAIVIAGFHKVQSHNSEILYREMLGLEKQKLKTATNTIASMLEGLCLPINVEKYLM